MVTISPTEFDARISEETASSGPEYDRFFSTPFDCACGETHLLRPWMEVTRELPTLRFVVACPLGRHLTLLQVCWDSEGSKGFLVGELGTELECKRESRRGIEFQADFLKAKTGRNWSLEETETFMNFHFMMAARRRGVRVG